MTSSGCCASSSRSSRDERVELGVAELGIVEDEVALGVVVDQLAQRRGAIDDLLRGGRGHAASRLTLGADRELRRRGLVVHAVAELPCEQHRPLGLTRTVAGEAARGRDQRLLPQPDRVATSTRQLAPHVEQRLPQRRRDARRSGRASGPRPRRPSRRRRGSGSSAIASSKSTLSTSTCTTFGPAASATRRSPGTADVHAGEAARRGQRGRQEVGGEFAIERRCRAAPLHERGLVEEQHERAARAGGRRSSARVRRPSSRARRVPSANARDGATPASASARPSVNGPVTCALTCFGARGSASIASTNATTPAWASTRSSTSTDARGSRSPLIRIAPSSATSTPATPCIHCASIPSRALRCGSCGAAGSSGRHRRTRAAAASASRCGRLPTPVAIPAASTVEGMKFVVYGRPLDEPESRCRTSSCGARGSAGRCLPLAAGDALADALADWSHAPAVVATRVVVVRVGGRVCVALLAPRPWGLTCCASSRRAPSCVSVSSIPSTSALSATLAVASTIVAAAFALSAPVAQACGNALAYGDETRFPLRIPTPLLLGPVPLAVLARRRGHRGRPAAHRRRQIVARRDRARRRVRRRRVPRPFAARAVAALARAGARRRRRRRPADPARTRR